MNLMRDDSSGKESMVILITRPISAKICILCLLCHWLNFAKLAVL
ncbi:hypothetical protein COLO4_20683 [Corchorus olitorius]|uniref:Uncharacterized protein n=1 Tax=Corchorus olitorius TaxID=93759 RepID=A0A1R3IXT1_9ROSI|nr:hypothetical protein COLO4_20683 [Corchorus olitorius]